VKLLPAGGGRHLFFRYDGERVPKELTRGIDLKGEGGYFVAPPSLHASGRRYSFDEEKGGKYAFLKPAPAPRWLLERIAAATGAKSDRQDVLAKESPTSGKLVPGSRHNHLVSLAGTMRKRGMTRHAIEAGLLVENREKCEPPKPEAEVRQIAESVSRYEPAAVTVKSQEDWPEIIPLNSHSTDPIPPGCLPCWLGEMALAVSESTETPFEMAALLGLAVASSCVAAKADVSPEPGYTEPLNLNTCSAMESGNRKTAVFSSLIDPLSEFERLEVERTEPERRRLLSERKTKEAVIERLRKKAKTAGDLSSLMEEIHKLETSLPEVAIPPRLFCDDVTPERLAGVMQEQGGRIAVFSDEGGIFDILGGRYSKGVPNLDVWLKGHSASPLRVDRQDRSRPPIIIDKPHLTVGISPQPDVLASLRDKPGFRGRGLLARFLYALPKSRLGYRALTPKAVPQDIRNRYQNGIWALLAYRPNPMVHLHFTSEAYREWKEFQRGLEPQFRDGGMLGELKDWGSKLPGAAARIAGVFHMAMYAGRVDVPLAVEKPPVVAAVELAACLISHCRAVFALMENDPETTKAERIIAWIIRENSAVFRLRDCFRAHQGLFKRVNELTPTLTLLEQHGYVRIVHRDSSGGRPPGDLVEVNPTVLQGLVS
jgi:hypothetical protein